MVVSATTNFFSLFKKGNAMLDLHDKKIEIGQIAMNCNSYKSKNHFEITPTIYDMLKLLKDTSHILIVSMTREQEIEFKKEMELEKRNREEEKILNYIPKGRIYKSIESLNNAIVKKEEQIEALNKQETEQFSNLGHGYAMRAYSRLKKMSNSKSDKLSDSMEDLYMQHMKMVLLSK